TGQTGFWGYVMPNWGSNNTSFNGGGGAVGTAALRSAYQANTGTTLDISDMRDRKQAFFYLLRDRNKNINSGAGSGATAWDKMGSAVVVHTMLGSKFDSPDRNRARDVSDATWDEFQR